MSKINTTIVAFLLGVAVTALIRFASPVVAANPAPAASPNEEYMVVWMGDGLSAKNDIEPKVNELAKQGWKVRTSSVAVLWLARERR